MMSLLAAEGLEPVYDMRLYTAEADRTCFSYPERKLDCYRVYQDSESIYFIRTKDSRDSPAGSLVVAVEEIKAGNTEKYPFVSN